MRRLCMDAALACLLLLSLLPLLQARITQTALLQQYLAYLQRWGKHRTPEEIPVRLEYFKAAVQLIAIHNADPSRGFKLELNEFADWSEEEIQAMFAPAPPLEQQLRRDALPANGDTSVHALGLEKMKEPVEHVNWASSDNPLGKSVVSPVRNQGLCGACWAFTAAGTTEGSVAINTGKLLPLSVQQLVDCDDRFDRGCNGGNPLYAYQYIQKKGLVAWDDYPYTAGEGKCKADKFQPVASITGFAIVPSYDEVALAAAVAKGPVAAGICGTHKKFMYYASGIFDDPMCCIEQNHAVLLVGYGVDSSGTPYWVAKNSWGTKWGEGGYIRLRRSISKARSAGQCGIAISASAAIGGYACNYTTNSDKETPQSSNRFREWATEHWRELTIAVSIVIFCLSLLAFLHTVFVREPVRFRSSAAAVPLTELPNYWSIAAATDPTPAEAPAPPRVVRFSRSHQYQPVSVQETTPLRAQPRGSINI